LGLSASEINLGDGEDDFLSPRWVAIVPFFWPSAISWPAAGTAAGKRI